MSFARALVRRVVPVSVRRARAQFVWNRLQRQVDRAGHRGGFGVIYRERIWGEGGDGFNSGWGSHAGDLVDPYVTSVRDFIATLPEQPAVLDLGCGDFNVGRQIRPFCGTYVAADVVPELIERNREIFADEDVDFRVLDLATDSLPPCTIVFLRQVLQHLSNDLIQQALPKLARVQYIVLTDHAPTVPFVPNAKHQTGPDTRIKVGSALDLTADPFNLEPVESREMVRVAIPHSNGEQALVTTLYRMW